MAIWKQVQPLDTARYQLAAGAFKNYLVAAGGSLTVSSPVTFPTSLLVSRVNAVDDDIGHWDTQGSAFAAGKLGCALQVDPEGYVYVAGGWGGGLTGAAQAEAQVLYSARLNQDGVLGPWSTSAMPVPLVEASLLQFDRWMYLLGGNLLQVALKFKSQTGNFTVGDLLTGGSSGATGTIVSQWDAGTTGTLILSGVVGTFTNTETVTDAHTGSAAADGTQFLRKVAQTAIYRARLDSGGAIGVWTQVGDLPVPMALNGAAALVGDRVYCYHADTTLAFKTQTVNFTVGTTITGGSSGATGIIYAQVDGGSTGTLSLSNVVGTFTDTETITDSKGGSAVADGTQALVGSLYQARLQRTQDGAALWSSATTGFARRRHGLVAFQDKLLVVGGYDGAAADLATVRVGTLDRDGNLVGQWSETEPMLTAKDGHATVLVGNRLYCIGGGTITPTAQTEVEAALLSSSGTIGGTKF